MKKQKEVKEIVFKNAIAESLETVHTHTHTLCLPNR